MNSDGNGKGDVCDNDCDGDGIHDNEDVCPCNNYIDKTDFRAIQSINLGDNSYDQPPPQWEFRDEGKEIYQVLNSDPGVAIGDAKFSGVEYEGTMFVDCCLDNDWIGAVFSFQVKAYKKKKFFKIIKKYILFYRIARTFMLLWETVGDPMETIGSLKESTL